MAFEWISSTSRSQSHFCPMCVKSHYKNGFWARVLCSWPKRQASNRLTYPSLDGHLGSRLRKINRTLNRSLDSSFVFVQTSDWIRRVCVCVSGSLFGRCDKHPFNQKKTTRVREKKREGRKYFEKKSFDQVLSREWGGLNGGVVRGWAMVRAPFRNRLAINLVMSLR